MNYKRAIGFSVLVYLITFVIGIVAALVLDIDLEDVENVPVTMCVVFIVSAAILVGLFTRKYFRSPTTVASARNGFLFGIVAILTGFALDILSIVILPSLGGAEGGFEMLLDYYKMYYFWLTVAAILITATLVGSKMASRGRTPTQNPV